MLKIEKLSKTINKKKILSDISFEIGNEFAVLLGKSGSGKSTLIRVLSGLLSADEGTILLNEKNITDRPPKDRDIAMIFQSYALYPHMNVCENILFPRSRKQLGEAQKIARLLGVEESLRSYPANISGGEQQRVAIGRAMMEKKELYLLDEPLSNLDSKNKNIIRKELTKLQKEVRKPFLMATHDISDALTMGDRILVHIDGRIVQNAAPKKLYDDPISLEVLKLISVDGVNVLRGQRKDGMIILEDADRTALPENGLRCRNYDEDRDREVLIAFRPNDLRPDDGQTEGYRMSMSLYDSEHYGSVVKLYFREGNGNILSMLVSSNDPINKKDLGNLVIPFEKIFVYPQ